MPTKILKEYGNLYCDNLTNCYNTCTENGEFPDSLKMSDVSAAYKKKSKTDKGNYRPLSKLPNVSKLFVRVMHDDISGFFSDKFSPLLSGFRSMHSTQQALLSMIDKWKKSLDKKRSVAAVLMDLSKAFDCVDHSLLIAKFHAYGFSKSALWFVHSYLSDRIQRVVIGSDGSSWKSLDIGVPQGSILGPLFFNVYINDLFFSFNVDPTLHLCNYADDNTLYSIGDNRVQIFECLKSGLRHIHKWFSNNGLQLNLGKCQLIVLGPKNDVPTIFSVDGIN